VALDIDDLNKELKSGIKEGTGAYEISNNNLVEVIDTPMMWGVPFSDTFAVSNHGEASKLRIILALQTIIRNATHTLDIVSLAPPSGEFKDCILDEVATKIRKGEIKQVRFLFGYLPAGEDTVKAFRKEISRHFLRSIAAAVMNVDVDLYVGRVHGDKSGGGKGPLSPWNHAKIVAADGKYALVGGHNLWPHNYSDYPPVHDISLFLCGDAAHSAQKFCDMLWTISGTNISNRNTWTRYYKFDFSSYTFPDHKNLTLNRWCKAPPDNSTKVDSDITVPPWMKPIKKTADLKVLGVSRFTISDSVLNSHAGQIVPNYPSPSEKAKEFVIKSATHRLYICQQDLLFKGAEKIDNHNTIKWIVESLCSNRDLVVKIVVSSINAKSKDGSAYSWGSGAYGTYKEIYKLLYEKLRTKESDFQNAIQRIHVAPFCFTAVTVSRYGSGHAWSDTVKYGFKQAQFSTKVPLPKLYSYKYPEPANHSKFYMGYDNNMKGIFYVGSDNMYPHDLFEYGYMISDGDALKHIYDNYWSNIWKYSGPNCVCSVCRSGWRSILSDTAIDYESSLSEKMRRPSRESKLALELVKNFISSDPPPSNDACHYLALLLAGEQNLWPRGKEVPRECNSPLVKNRGFSKAGTTFIDLLVKNSGSRGKY
jgi:murine toxin